jgi:hypothetical protein
MTDPDLVAAIRERTRVLYEGKQVAHRSCGVALAEAFGADTAAYRTLRRGGLDGSGPCGAVLAGQMILGEVFGDPDPAGAVTPALRESVGWYRAELQRRLGGAASATCASITAPFPVFQSPERHDHCTGLVAVVAEVLGEAILRFGGSLPAPR